MILPGTAIDGARLVAERTRQNIDKTTFRYDGKVLSLTVSVGIAQLALQRTLHANAPKSRSCHVRIEKGWAETGPIGMMVERSIRLLASLQRTRPFRI